ncbi:ShlB/FhaC/HecB family hemolysin secretion/activation protein [Mastigocladopsis repens]|uniref:ShlB/FhaC/HecB family hemolysin secretion/activation protein n=1 Tax=Mastigocladopsis repens TaxID=221287 RepID=UPI0002FDB954|nr:ShlB/FhaC/HecB family hemolysin secretion/activation protein [Mastigocladopsis repens]
MNQGGQLGCGKLSLAVALVINIFISFSYYKASAKSLLNESSNAKILPLAEFQILTFTHSNTTSTVILSQVQNPTQVPNPITPIPPPQPIPTPQPPPETPLDLPPSTPPSSAPRLDTPGTISVKKFEFEGNTEKVFSDQKLSEVTAQFTNRPITFTELLQVEAVVTKLYTDAGYINSGAFIPANQTFPQQGAVVKVQIVEGGLEEIKVTGTRRLNPNYLRSRIQLGTSRPLNRYRLLEALQLLQLNPLIQNLSAELSAGSRSDQSLLEVRVVEADSFRTELFVDNGRAPSVGSFRRGIRISEGNVFGIGDSFAATYTNTDGSNALDLNYAVPLNPRNGTLNLAGGFTDTTVIEPPFDRIDITGDSFYIDVGFRQPIIQSPTRELALGLTFSRQQSKTKLQGEDYALSPGSDENGETRISALRFFQEYTQRSPQQVLALRSQFSLGVGLFDATINNEPPDSRFFSWRGQGQYVRLLAPETLLVLRSDLQFTTRALVPLEQFSLGGLQSVRGYRQDQLLVDNGFFASAEVRLPVVRVERVEGVLQVVPFVDFGIGWNSSDTSDLDPNTLVSVGLGLQWQMGDGLTARLDYGIGLTDVDSSDRTLQEKGFYFSVNYSPF